MKISYKYALALGAVLVGVLACRFILNLTVVKASAGVAFTAEVEDTIYNRSGGDPIVLDTTEAFSSDGRDALYRVAFTPDGRRYTVRRVTKNGKRMVFNSLSHAMTTTTVKPGKPDRTYIGIPEYILGHAVYKSTQKDLSGPHNQLWTITEWRAPDLGGYLMRDEQYVDGWLNSTHTVKSISMGEPNEDLFSTPTSVHPGQPTDDTHYTEMKPSDRMAADHRARKDSRPICTTCDAGLDAVYAAHQ